MAKEHQLHNVKTPGWRETCRGFGVRRQSAATTALWLPAEPASSRAAAAPREAKAGSHSVCPRPPNAPRRSPPVRPNERKFPSVSTLSVRMEPEPSPARDGRKPGRIVSVLPSLPGLAEDQTSHPTDESAGYSLPPCRTGFSWAGVAERRLDGSRGLQPTDQGKQKSRVAERRPK